MSRQNDPQKTEPVKPSESDHFDGTRFFNPRGENPAKGLFSVLKWKLGSRAQPWPSQIVDDNVAVDLNAPILDRQLRVVYVNHATLLLQWDGLNILTDPTMMKGIGPLGLIPRYRKPGVALEQLPRIDIALVSHNHYDHLDVPSLRALYAQTDCATILPLGCLGYLPKQGLSRARELDWWETHRDPAHKVSITFVPAQHWSKRTPFDTNRSLWGGFVVERDGISVFFAGDTGYGPHFREIAERLPRIDVALLPIGAYEPRFFMKAAHMNPEEAVRAAEDLDARNSIGIHFGTFRLTDEAIEAPVEDLKRAVAERDFLRPFYAPKNGDAFTFEASP